MPLSAGHTKLDEWCTCEGRGNMSFRLLAPHTYTHYFQLPLVCCHSLKEGPLSALVYLQENKLLSHVLAPRINSLHSLLQADRPCITSKAIIAWTP